VRTKASILLILLGMILGACAPEGTPAGARPDLSGKVVLAGPATIVSASASPASFAYAYGCGSTSVLVADITFTVLINDPSDVGSENFDVEIHYEFSAGGPTYIGNFILAQAGTVGTVYTYSDDIASNQPKWLSTLTAVEAGASGVFRWQASLFGYPVGSKPGDPGGKLLDKTGFFEIPFAPCKAPLVTPPVATILPPHLDVTIMPPGSADKPKQGGGGSPPSCSVEPNNPSCVP
jgi:hypothetical protein